MKKIMMEKKEVAKMTTRIVCAALNGGQIPSGAQEIASYYASVYEQILSSDAKYDAMLELERATQTQSAKAMEDKYERLLSK